MLILCLAAVNSEDLWIKNEIGAPSPLVNTRRRRRRLVFYDAVMDEEGESYYQDESPNVKRARADEVRRLLSGTQERVQTFLTPDTSETSSSVYVRRSYFCRNEMFVPGIIKDPTRRTCRSCEYKPGNVTARKDPKGEWGAHLHEV